MNQTGKNPVKITDVTFRDGHQSIFATRMTTADMAAIAPEMNRIGFHSMEVWGGATFDVATRFLNEDPWERPKILKNLMPDTPLQMLLRGQNLVGYRHYADDVVEEFIKHSAEVGIDIFRVFDALNDERNMITSLRAIKKAGKHAQLAISYSLTERKMGGPVFNLEYYVNKAKILEQMGADSIAIKDMAGLIAPDDAFKLISALKKAVNVPLQLHTHYSSGMASMSCLKAIEAGVDEHRYLCSAVRPALFPSGNRTDTGSAGRNRQRYRAGPGTNFESGRLSGIHCAEIPAIYESNHIIRDRCRRAGAPDSRRHDFQPGGPTQTVERLEPHQRSV